MKQSMTGNERVAELFDEVAEILEFQGANPFRISSYRRAAEEVRALHEPVSKLYEREGIEGLRTIEGVGKGLSAGIAEIVETGELTLLVRLRAELSPTDVFASLPGVGKTLAERIVEELGVESLEELEQAVYDGRIEEVEGIGHARARGLGYALRGMLNQGGRRRGRSSGDAAPQQEEPSVEWLLNVDAEYRQRARTGELRRIAPRRFNPENERWLPIMEAVRGGRRFTALFSNTRRAHQLGRTHDWVVIYIDDEQGTQYTVVTATSGALRDKRVVRGRERECREYYERRRQAGQPGLF